MKRAALGEIVKEKEKAQKYSPLMWQLRERNPGYQVKHVQKKRKHHLIVFQKCNLNNRQSLIWYNIGLDVLGWIFSQSVSQTVKELVGEKRATILQRMQRSVISSTLSIALFSKFLLKQR